MANANRIEPLARRVAGADVQALQQFVGQSPWAWEPVRRRLAQRMAAQLEPPAAWIIDDTGFPKQGRHSVGVARQYSGTLGKVGNCQVAVTVHLSTATESMPLNWALYLPQDLLGRSHESVGIARTTRPQVPSTRRCNRMVEASPKSPEGIRLFATLKN
jgi:SRSO17 transposase